SWGLLTASHSDRLRQPSSTTAAAPGRHPTPFKRGGRSTATQRPPLDPGGRRRRVVAGWQRYGLSDGGVMAVGVGSLQSPFLPPTPRKHATCAHRGGWWYHPRRPTCLCSAGGPTADGAEQRGGEGGAPERVLLVERYDNGTAKRFIVDDGFSRLRTCWDEATDGQEKVATSSADLSWLPDVLKNFILPAGFPGSVSDDYLEYMLLQFPTNVTGWVCHTLVTSSLLKAVGIGSFSGTSAAASAAAIRWVSKDGLGAIGRLFVGGRFGNLFDDDPKLWRMYADFIGSAGSIFDLSTQLYPAYFLPLASLGNLTKAIARGLKDPSFRVIQTHFAISGNLGEVAAKEEVWEVVAQLLGLAFGILILDIPGMERSYSILTFTWLTVRLMHLWLRYQSLSVLRFSTINLKRARVLVKSHISNSIVPGYVVCNREEDILSWEYLLRPSITFGVSFEQLIGWNCSSQMIQTILKMYSKETYILYVDTDQPGEPKFLVSFKVGATGLSVLRSVWQAYWLHSHWGRGSDHALEKLEESLAALSGEGGFPDFLEKMERSGWDTNAIHLRVPKGPLLDDAAAAEHRVSSSPRHRQRRPSPVISAVAGRYLALAPASPSGKKI
ncbi:hypothetical protein Taro_016372, partial [Colocasia esculenta]|nr:hypothetical protein [Colocasia esculenta]